MIPRAFAVPLVVCLLAAAVGQQGQKDILKRTIFIKGKFMGFEAGDYLHAVVQDEKKQTRSFFVDGDGVDFFLALNHKKTGTYKIQVVDAYVPEAGSRMEMERVVFVRFGKADSASWWKVQAKKSSRENLEKKYYPAVVKAMIQ